MCASIAGGVEEDESASYQTREEERESHFGYCRYAVINTSEDALSEMGFEAGKIPALYSCLAPLSPAVQEKRGRVQVKRASADRERRDRKDTR